jgi:hypothetical protein
MKKITRPVIILLLSLALALTSVAFSGVSSIQQSIKYPQVVLFLQTTSTPQLEEDRSEIGSTDWITVMSFVIVAIIVIPIVLKRKSWSQV